MTRPAVCVHVCRPLRFCVSSSDQCVTGDGEPCSHLSPVRLQRRSTIHPHLARQRAGLQGSVNCKHTHTHTHTHRQPHQCRTMRLYVPLLSLSRATDLTLCAYVKGSVQEEYTGILTHAYIESPEIQQINVAN